MPADQAPTRILPLHRIITRLDDHRPRTLLELAALATRAEGEVEQLKAELDEARTLNAVLQDQLKLAQAKAREQAEELAVWRRTKEPVPAALAFALSSSPHLRKRRTVRGLLVDGRPIKGVVVNCRGTIDRDRDQRVWEAIVNEVREYRRERAETASA